MDEGQSMKNDKSEAATVVGTYATLKEVVAAGRPDRVILTAGIMFSLIQVASTLAFPILSQRLIDSMAQQVRLTSAILMDPMVLQLMAVLLLGALTGGVSGYLLSRAGLGFTRRLKQEMIASVLDRPMLFFDKQDSGDIVSRLNNDTRSISSFATKGVAGLFEGVLLLVGTLVVLFVLDAKLTVLIFLVILGAFGAMAPVFLRNSKLTVQINDMQGAFSATATRCFSNIRLVKAYTAESQEMKALNGELGCLEERSRRIALIESILSPVNGLALTIAMLIIFAYGGSRVAMGTLTIGTLTAFILCIFNIVGPLIQLSVIISQFQSAKGSSSQVADILDRKLAEKNSQVGADRRGLPVPLIDGALDFDGVKFGYGSDAFLDLDGLRIECGERVGLVGPSGCGKSTIFSLLARLYPLSQGSIRLNGQNILEFDLAEWRQQIGLVPQSANLMTGTILENIAYGCEKVERQRAERAAEAANCLEFINTMTNGFDSSVGENGSLLSGGQRQRIAIARVFYRDPQILLLDEATANLDGGNETKVLAAVERLMAGRTTIVIAHHESALAGVDTLIRISNGGWSTVRSRKQNVVALSA